MWRRPWPASHCAVRSPSDPRPPVTIQRPCSKSRGTLTAMLLFRLHHPLRREEAQQPRAARHDPAAPCSKTCSPVDLMPFRLPPSVTTLHDVPFAGHDSGIRLGEAPPATAQRLLIRERRHSNRCSKFLPSDTAAESRCCVLVLKNRLLARGGLRGRRQRRHNLADAARVRELPFRC